MSMGAALGLMSKLALSVVGCTSLSAFSSALKSGAKSNVYALKLDSGIYKDWLIINAVKNANPNILDPNYPDINDTYNKGFFKNISDLKFRYPTANPGDYAFIIDEKWIWHFGSSTPDWIDSGYKIPVPNCFDSESLANSYIYNHDLKYTYPDSSISTVSAFKLIAYTSNSNSNINKMADDPECGLAQPCMNKYNQTISMDPPHQPTAGELLSAIEEKMMPYL